MAGDARRVDYEGIESRKVTQSGTNRWNQSMLGISTALAGWNVGLDPGPDGMVDVYFTRLLVGQIEEETASFLPAKGAASHAVNADRNQPD